MGLENDNLQSIFLLLQNKNLESIYKKSYADIITCSIEKPVTIFFEAQF